MGTIVRMGELAVSGDARDVLLTIGLGSCIGLVLLDRARGVAGLAHVVLPAAAGVRDEPAKFADRAVPALLGELTALGAQRIRTEAVLVGGAQMFDFQAAGRAALEIGARNEAATRDALAAARIPVVAAATGGSRGRTVRVLLESMSVTVKEAGGREIALYEPAGRRVAA
jgi:chemotaxis protein CheD